MLVIFSSKSSVDVTMFGDIGVKLLKLMGHSGKVPGAFYAEDVASALTKLETGLQSDADKPQPDIVYDDDEEDIRVSLSTRAQPLINLLKAAIRENDNVMWEDKS